VRVQPFECAPGRTNLRSRLPMNVSYGWQAMRLSDAMQLTPRRIVFYILMVLITLLVLIAPIWLGLGPVVHSDTTARISN
jgi:hypothetical protein